MASATDIATAILNVGTDPCLGTVVDQLNTLHDLEQTPEVPGQPPPPPSPPKLGIGLCKAVPVLDTAIYAKKNPRLFLFLGLGIVGGIFYAGMRFERRRNKK